MKELAYPVRDNAQESKPLLIRIINCSQTHIKGVVGYFDDTLTLLRRPNKVILGEGPEHLLADGIDHREARNLHREENRKKRVGTRVELPFSSWRREEMCLAWCFWPKKLGRLVATQPLWASRLSCQPSTSESCWYIERYRFNFNLHITTVVEPGPGTGSPTRLRHDWSAGPAGCWLRGRGGSRW